jgi:putative hydrolase of the HAD superfamily
MTSFPSGISAIIFDLGGVLVDISVAKTIKALAKLSGVSPEDIQGGYVKYPAFFAYERGEISDIEFRTMLKKTFSFEATDEEIDQCWNAMLLELPERKLRFLEKLKNEFSVYALSNTNNIHIQYVNSIFLKDELLDGYFHKCYYSHEVGMRKPEPRIYSHVLQDANLIPDKTLFLDDNAENLMAAKVLGIQTLHVTHPDRVFDLIM